MFTCQPSSVPRVKVNTYIQFGPYICYFCSIRSQFLLTLTNLVPIEDVTKFIFGLNMFLVLQVSAKFGISSLSKLLTNLVIYLSKCVNLVLLTKFC